MHHDRAAVLEMQESRKHVLLVHAIHVMILLEERAEGGRGVLRFRELLLHVIQETAEELVRIVHVPVHGYGFDVRRAGEHFGSMARFRVMERPVMYCTMMLCARRMRLRMSARQRMVRKRLMDGWEMREPVRACASHER